MIFGSLHTLSGDEEIKETFFGDLYRRMRLNAVGLGEPSHECPLVGTMRFAIATSIWQTGDGEYKDL